MQKIRPINLFALAMFLSFFAFISCSRPIEKKLEGVWQIEDIKFDADTNIYDTSELADVIEDQKSVRFELYAGDSLKIYTGSTSINGKWSFNEKDQGVYVFMANSPDSVLMGIYKDGKLVNEENDSGLKIITIFKKIKSLD